MCGIVGWVSRDTRLEAESLIRMRDALRHRGPDDAGSWLSPDGRVALAHRRLAVLDLSPAAAQPMIDISGSLVLVYNGEIYNHPDVRRDLEARGHRFRSRSDTEVLLAAYREWGTDCLDRLDGMFAFSLWDAEKRRLFCARDRAGEKPFFYRHDPGAFRFASELKALLADPAAPRVLDRDALEHYLAYGYVPGELCILQGYRKLPPAHLLVYDLDTDRLDVRRYWDLPPPPDPGAPANPDALSEELESLLQDAVRRQLVADVPVGLLLSGGVDSGLVAAAVARAAGGRVRAYTIGFPGHGGFDETAGARRTAQHLGLDHEVLEAEPATADLLPILASQFDEPVADSSMIPTCLVSKLIRQRCTVALGGDGGDELFGGYISYTRILALDRWGPLLCGPVRALAGLAAEALPLGFKGRTGLLQLSQPPGRRHAAFWYFDPATRRRLLPDRPPNDTPSPEEVRLAAGAGGATPLQSAQRADFRSYLPDDILVKVDRASMLCSLEVRAPWLDRRLIEFAYGRVPDALNATSAERKILPRRLAARRLHHNPESNRKQGFSIPLDRWFSSTWGNSLADILLDVHDPLFQIAAVRNLWLAAGRGRPLANALFALALFELWRHAHRVVIA
jgi:asparagine synthase (glutamine-hydrolysing)